MDSRGCFVGKQQSKQKDNIQNQRFHKAYPFTVMETSKTKLGADHPSTLTSMANFASIYRNQGRWLEVEKLEVQVMEICKTKLGADHPDTLISMGNLAFIWKDQGRHSDALALQEDCAQARHRVLGAEHPDMLQSLAAVERWSRWKVFVVSVYGSRESSLQICHRETRIIMQLSGCHHMCV